jgi:hypothetical protein
MATGINDKIAQFLRECQTWEKNATNILGVFLLKLRASKQNPSSIAIEINPTNTAGAAVKDIIIVVVVFAIVNNLIPIRIHSQSFNDCLESQVYFFWP